MMAAKCLCSSGLGMVTGMPKRYVRPWVVASTVAAGWRHGGRRGMAFMMRPTPLQLCDSRLVSPICPVSSVSRLERHAGGGWPLFCYRGAERSDEDVIDVSGDGGVTKRVIRPGFGYKHNPPPQGAYCKIAFSVMTDTGKMIANRMDRPMEFILGLERPEVIPGWEMAIATMIPNEIAEITCSPGYAFGADGYEDKIPPSATIITRMHLINWRVLQSSASTDIQDTHELSKKWRRELEEGTSPMTAWTKRPRKPVTPEENGGEQVKPVGDGPLYDAQQQLLKEAAHAQASTSSSSDATSSNQSPLFEEIPAKDPNSPKPKVDLNDPKVLSKLNPNQIVLGDAPQYKWREGQEWLELMVPVPNEVSKKDVLVHMTPKVLMVGFRTKEGQENWIVGGELFGAIESGGSFWVLNRETNDELAQGRLCVEVRLEKKEPLRRIWATVFKEE